MNTLLYFVVIAACMMGLSHILPGFHVNGWWPAVLASLILGLLNAVLKPILFVLTLPITIVTLGLFLFVLNAIMLWLTSKLVPGFHISGFGTTFIASLILAAVGMIWKSITRPARV
ncbi:MAG TPA: phage holin family protein [Candidatus Sulfotelmatobacter sp.]|nr:phage holin family protein [Candidatus Sulfotelmatobacter sp.]